MKKILFGMLLYKTMADVCKSKFVARFLKNFLEDLMEPTRPAKKSQNSYYGRRPAYSSGYYSRNNTPPVVELYFDNESEMHDIVESMVEVARKYQFASVADLYERVGTGTKYADSQWGWTESLLSETITKDQGDGAFSLKLPRPVRI